MGPRVTGWLKDEAVLRATDLPDWPPLGLEGWGHTSESERVVLSSGALIPSPMSSRTYCLGQVSREGLHLAQARSGMDTLESCRMHAGISR